MQVYEDIMSSSPAHSVYLAQRARPILHVSSLPFLVMAASLEGKNPPTRLNMTCILIIVVASVERFAYKGVASNMVTYLTEVVHLSTSSAAKSVNYWCGVTSMLPLLGAFLADSFWDRHSTILFSSIIYVAGLGALTTWTMFQKHLPSSSLFFPLYLISLGQGGYNPSLQAFGADQIEQEQKSVFFQWWYFGICAGSLLGNSLMSYVQDNYGWVIGFAVPATVMAISSVSFAAGSFIGGFRRALLRRLKGRSFRLPTRDDEDDVELEGMNSAKPLKDDEVRNSGEVSLEAGAKSPAPENKTCSGDLLGRVILKLIPTWATLLIFAVIFQLPSTFFTHQGSAMERNIGPNFTIPPAALQSTITISIIILMPMYNNVIIPCIRVITKREEGINVRERIGVGMVLSVAAMAAAAEVERRRVGFYHCGGGKLSIFWLLPQYVLLGVADVFTVVGMQEFFYGGVPASMRTIGIGLYLSVFGVGSFLSSGLIWAVDSLTEGSWFSEEIGGGHLDRFYWLLSVLCAFSFVVFVLIR